MKTEIKYAAEFRIPKTLPHAPLEGEESTDIFDDDVRVVDGELVLSSRCGETRFRDFKDQGDSFLIPAGAYVRYKGAYAALNAVWGIKFPAYELGWIESRYGQFRTQAGYDLARRAIVFASQADRNNAVKRADEAFDQIAERSGNPLFHIPERH